jgi:hypothetical protein
MGALFMPVHAFAADIPEPPTVEARIEGDTLHIEATDNGLGVEAVYISDIRFNYRVDGALEVDARDYCGDGEKISVYAVDFAGNKSNVVEIDNPYYAEPLPDPEETESAIPVETPENQPFTPSGTGTVVDNVTEKNGKEFFTITTDAGNVFYLIVDRQRAEENVYLLNAVTEDDLAALAEKSEKKDESAIPVPPAPTTTTEQPEVTPAPEEPPAAESNNSGMMIFIVIAALAAGGAGYYFKIVRPKQQAADDEFDDDEDGEDGGEDDADMEFEKDPDENEDAASDDADDTDSDDGGEDGEPETEDD